MRAALAPKELRRAPESSSELVVFLTAGGPKLLSFHMYDHAVFKLARLEAASQAEPSAGNVAKA